MLETSDKSTASKHNICIDCKLPLLAHNTKLGQHNSMLQWWNKHTYCQTKHQPHQ